MALNGIRPYLQSKRCPLRGSESTARGKWLRKPAPSAFAARRGGSRGRKGMRPQGAPCGAAPNPLVRATLSEHLGFWQASQSLCIGATLSCNPILFGNCYGLFLGAAPGGGATLPGAAVYLRVHASNGPAGPSDGAGAHRPRVLDPRCADG